MSDIKNLYNDLVNFYNVNDENFKEFMAKMYEEMLANHRDVKYVKEHLYEEIVKILDEYLVDGKIKVNIRQVVDEFLNNSDVINDINTTINDMNTSINNSISDINTQLDTIENNKTDKTTTQNLQTQVNNLVLQSGNPESSSAEIVQARGEFTVLNERLDAMYEKNVVKNIIKNSALNNTDSWGTYGCNISAENGVLTIVGSEQYAQVRNNEIPVKYGDKLYIRCGVNSGSNSNIKVEVIEQYTSEVYLSLDCSSTAGLNFYSGVATITKADIIYSMFRVINYENSSVPFQVTKPLMVNLTKVFGEGNEPSAREFEKMLSELYFEKTYIDNSELMKKIDNTKRVITNMIGNETQIKWVDGNNNMMLVFKPCGVNNLPQIKDLY